MLTHKEVPYTFHDLEPDMGSPKHPALHPFDRVPILQHVDFMLYETNAIVAYLEEVFPRPPLQPAQPRDRVLMNQWIGDVRIAITSPAMTPRVAVVARAERRSNLNWRLSCRARGLRSASYCRCC